eukprot:1158537-Pelagomonas_calceolata.AAC.16
MDKLLPVSVEMYRGARGEQGAPSARHSHSTGPSPWPAPSKIEAHPSRIGPKNQFKAYKQQHCDLCRHPSRALAQVTLHTNLLGVSLVTYTPHTLEPLKELGLDIDKATELALKLHAHSVQYTYALASTRHALEKTSLKSHHRDQAQGTASNPSDPY